MYTLDKHLSDFLQLTSHVNLIINFVVGTVILALQDIKDTLIIKKTKQGKKNLHNI
jgi:hypothetical protein